MTNNKRRRRRKEKKSIEGKEEEEAKSRIRISNQKPSKKTFSLENSFDKEV